VEKENDGEPFEKGKRCASIMGKKKGSEKKEK